MAQLLLERLPEFCDPQGEEAELPQLILGQLRWWVLHLTPNSDRTKTNTSLSLCTATRMCKAFAIPCCCVQAGARLLCLTAHLAACLPCRLDHVADARGLTDKLLEVLTVCPEELKKDAISFLPEVATEDSHQVRAGLLGCWGAGSWCKGLGLV